VARLVARGATNREIGRSLFITVNTVKTHVDHIYTKLDVSSRAQVAALVTRVERSNRDQDMNQFSTHTTVTFLGQSHNDHFRKRFAQRG
jgi:hypothetical protein